MRTERKLRAHAEHVARALQTRARAIAFARRFPETERRDGMLRLGSDYGRWTIPAHALDEASVCYLIGIGEDISFDLAVIARFGCEVHAFDPVPKAQEFAAAAARCEPRQVLHRFGIWSHDTEIRFHVPAHEGYVSHSATNLQGTTDFFVAPVRALPSVMRELGHDHVDLLKISAEGAEYEILEHALGSGLRPAIVCLELAQPATLDAMGQACRALIAAGYELGVADGWRLTFLRREQRPA